jgi:hypothetical protein
LVVAAVPFVALYNSYVEITTCDLVEITTCKNVAYFAKAGMRNHAPDIAAMDLFVVPTIGFDLIYACVIVRLDRRDIVWTNVTAANPTAAWVAPQIAEAFPWAGVPRHLIRDRIYDAVVTRRLCAMGSGIGPLHQPRLGRMALLCWQPTVRQQAGYMRSWNRSGTKCENSLTPRSSILRTVSGGIVRRVRGAFSGLYRRASDFFNPSIPGSVEIRTAALAPLLASSDL